MPIIDVTKDPDNRTLRMTAHFNAPVARVWQVYADPRQFDCDRVLRDTAELLELLPATPGTPA